MSTPNSNKFLKLKREREIPKTEASNKKTQKSKLNSSKLKKGKKNKSETDSLECNIDEENLEDTKLENSLGQLNRNFLQYIKKKGRVNININDLVKDLGVKKRRIYDITNVLQGIGYIEKKGKNEISWTKNYKANNNTNSNTNSLAENYISNCNNLKIEFEDLKKEDKENDDKIMKYREEFNFLTGRIDFPKYGYVTFNDASNLSKNDNLDFLIIKAAKGTLINVIDDDEAKKAFLKIKTQMENGKIQKNEKLLSTLENSHHIFLNTKNEKLKIFRVKNGEIIETFNNNRIGGQNNYNYSLMTNNKSLIYSEILPNLKNNMRFKDNKLIGKNENNLNTKENMNKSNIPNNISIPPQLNDLSKNVITTNNIIISPYKKTNTNNNQLFSFGNEQQSPNNNSNNFLFNFNKNENNDEIKEKNHNNIGISSMFK